MKTPIILITTIMAVVMARPQQNPGDAQIVKYENENIGVDGYKFAYETSDGIAREEQGTLKNAGSENEAIDVHGTYSWKDPATGQTFTVTFVADENGYRPQTSLSG